MDINKKNSTLSNQNINNDYLWITVNFYLSVWVYFKMNIMILKIKTAQVKGERHAENYTALIEEIMIQRNGKISSQIRKQ